MRSKKTGKGGMFIKIDLEKTYDMLKQSFVKETLQDSGLPQEFVDVTMK